MKIQRLVALVASAGALAAGTAGIGSGATPAAHAADGPNTLHSPVIGKLPAHLHASYGEPRGDTPQTLARSANRAVAAPASIPTYTNSFIVGGHTYVAKMVGKNPKVAQTTQSVTVPNMIIPVKFTFTSFGNTVFDPSAANACAGNKVPVNLVKNSPIYQNAAWTMNGQNVGTTQYVDAYRRAEYWKFTKPTGVNPNYHVLLSKTVLPTVSINVSGGNLYNAPCGKIGILDINSWDNYLRNTLMPSLAAQGVTQATLPVFLFSNVYMYDTTFANCCILGYHDAYTLNGAMQTYAVAAYDTSGIFSPDVLDIAPYSHEIAEWMDDPDVRTGGNPTPLWGNIGQVAGCQGNLENGDPLSGTMIPKTMPNGVTYHPQELAFVSWFFHTSPSWGTGGKYSDNGTFSTFAAPCP